MKIGISTNVHSKHRYWKQLDELIGLGFRDIEIYNKNLRVKYKDIEQLREMIKNFKLNLSLHSQVSDFGCPDKIITKGSFYYLRSEIRLAALAGFSSVNFHISKRIKLDSTLIDYLKELVRFSRENKIKLTLENNHSGPYAGNYLVEVLYKIKGLYFCLDLGHLHIALHNGSVKDKDKFLRIIRDKIIKMHVHYNGGRVDTHRGLDSDGKKYVKDVLRKINKKDIELIIEIWNIREALQAREFLKSF